MMNNIKSSALYRAAARRGKPLLPFLHKFFNDWSPEFAAMLAYYLLITILPTGIASFGIFGLVLRNYPDLQEEIKNKTIDLFPHDNTTQAGIRKVVDMIYDQLSNDAGPLIYIGIIFGIFGASRLFIAIDKCMTIIYRVPERTFLKKNLIAMGITLLYIILIPLMIVVSSVPTALLNFISLGGNFGTYLGGIIFSFIFAFIFFEITYWIVPNKKMSFRVTWCGSVVASCALEIWILLFPLYVRKYLTTYTGQIGFALLLLLFFFHFALFLILGAQINAFCFEHYKPLPHDLGTYISYMYQDQGDDDPGRPLLEEESDILERSSPTTTINAGQSSFGNAWLNKLVPSRTTSTNQQDEARENIA